MPETEPAPLAAPDAEPLAPTRAGPLAVPEAESLAAPQAESLAAPQAESLALTGAESLAAPQAESLAAPQAESLASPQAESLASPQAESLASPQAESLASPPAEPLAMPDAESLAAPTPEQVFREYAPRIYHLARRMLGNDADAEDVTQEVLVQVVRKLHTFRGESALPTWLHRVTVNAALALREKRANRARYEVPAGADTSIDPSLPDGSGRVRLRQPHPQQSPSDIVLADEQRELIDAAIHKLPTPYRDVYVLADVEGLPNQEVADMLELSLPAVKSRLHRARLQMRELLAPHFEEVAA